MSVFLPAHQAEIDDVVDIIPDTLEKRDVDGRTEIVEDIYSGLYIRMSDMVSKRDGLQSESKGSHDSID